MYLSRRLQRARMVGATMGNLSLARVPVSPPHLGVKILYQMQGIGKKRTTWSTLTTQNNKAVEALKTLSCFAKCATRRRGTEYRGVLATLTCFELVVRTLVARVV